VKTLGISSLLLLVAGAIAAAGASGMLPTDLQDQYGIRGSDPGPCSANWFFYPCSEQNAKVGNSCWQNDNNQPGCSPTQFCVGCNGTDQCSYCKSAKPWNAICGDTQIDSTGCGKYFTTSGCSWNANNNTCRCAGAVGDTNCAKLTTPKTADGYANPPTCMVQN